MIPWYLAVVCGLLGLGIGTFFMAIPHFLDVQERGYQEGYARGRTEESAAADVRGAKYR